MKRQYNVEEDQNGEKQKEIASFAVYNLNLYLSGKFDRNFKYKNLITNVQHARDYSFNLHLKLGITCTRFA